MTRLVLSSSFPRLLPKAIGAGLILLAGVALVAPPMPGDATAALAVILVTIGCWAGGFLPEHVVALGFFAVVTLLGLAPPEVAFAGFSSGPLWLIFAGLVFGLAMQETGLGRRAGLVGRRLHGASYARTVWTVVALAVGAIFVMPSAMGRIVLVTAIVAPLADRLGYRPGGRGHTGLVLAGAFGTFLPAFAVLPANVPNMVLAGTFERLFGTSFSFFDYLLLHFPVLGLARAAIVGGLVIRLYADRPDHGDSPEPEGPGPLRPGERRLAAVLAVAVTLWATDALHGLSPAWVGLAAAVACLTPGLGILPADALKRLNWAPLLHVAAVIGIGTVATRLGLGQWLAQAILGWMPLDGQGGIHDFAVLAGLPALLGVVTTAPGVPAILTPMAAELAAVSGLSVATVAMLQVLGFSTVLFPFQTPPMLAAAQASGVAMHEFQRLCLLTALAAVVVLWPLEWLWWQVVGMP